MGVKALVLGLSFVILWSSAFTSARVIVAHAPPLASLSLRFLISGLIGIALARALGQSWHLSRSQWRATFIFGLCQNTLYLGLFFVAMRWIEAGLAAILASAMPLLVALLNRLVFRERLSGMATLGLTLGLGGVLVIMGSRVSGGADMFAVSLCIIGTFALAIATLAARGAASGGNVLMVVGIQMLIGSVFLAIPAAALEQMQVIWSWKLIVAFAYTVLGPGLLATWLWFTLVNEIGAIRASVFHFLNPFFGVLIAALILGESVGAQDILGVGIVTLGILLVQVSKTRKRRGSNPA